MALVPRNQREMVNIVNTLQGVPGELVDDYNHQILEITKSMRDNQQQFNTTGEAASVDAIYEIQNFIASGGANRIAFQHKMEEHIALMSANRLMITQLPADIIKAFKTAYGLGGAMGVGGMYYAAWWNFTYTLSNVWALVSSNPLTAGAFGTLAGLQLKEFGIKDYLSLALMQRPELTSYDQYTIQAGLEHITEEAHMDSDGMMSYISNLVGPAIASAAPVAKSVTDVFTGNLASYTDEYARIKFDEGQLHLQHVFDIRDQFLKVTLILTAMLILMYVMIVGFRVKSARKYPGHETVIEMLESPMGGRVPRRRSRSRRMNTAVKRKGSPKRRKSTRRKSRSPKRKSTRRKSTRRKNSPKRKSKSKRRKSRRKSKSKRRKSMPKRKSKSRRRKSRRKSKTPKRKSKSKRRKSRRKSKSPKRKSTRKGQVRKTSRRAYMDLKTKPARRSRSRRRKDMM